MARFVLKDAKIIYGGRDLSGHLSQMGLEYSVETPECTAFGDLTKNRIPGLLEASASHQGYWDAESATDSLDSDLFDEIGAATEEMSFSAEGGPIGDTGYSFPVRGAEYSPGGTVGEVFAFSVNVSSGGILVRGSMMENSTFTVTADGTARQAGAAASTDSIYSIVHATTVSGTNPTMDLTLESDATNSFSGSETLRITHPQMTALGANRQVLAGAVTDTWWRYTITIGGTDTPTFALFVILAIQPTKLP